jgi:hypothetical protein
MRVSQKRGLINVAAAAAPKLISAPLHRRRPAASRLLLFFSSSFFALPDFFPSLPRPDRLLSFKRVFFFFYYALYLYIHTRTHVTRGPSAA